MSRCGCCDKRLNDFELTAKHAETGEYLDTCMKCLSGLDVPIDGREDLNKSNIPEDDFDGVVFDQEEFDDDT